MEAALKEKGGASKNLGGLDSGTDLLGTFTDMATQTTTAKNREFCSTNAKKASSKILEVEENKRLWNFDRKKAIQKHYEHNKKLNQFGSGQYIYDQSKLSNYRMGVTNSQHAGCGWVATYNALITLGTYKSPADLIKYYEENGVFANGVLGIQPFSIKDYFVGRGYLVESSIIKSQIDMLKEKHPVITIEEYAEKSTVSIIGYFATWGGHYIAIKTAIPFVAYNVYKNETTGSDYFSLYFNWWIDDRRHLYPFSAIHIS